MTQVKLFQSLKQDAMQNGINNFLQENDNSIDLVDIKYTSDILNPGNPLHSRVWSAMVIYTIK